MARATLSSTLLPAFSIIHRCAGCRTQRGYQCMADCKSGLCEDSHMEGSQKEKDMFGGKEVAENYIFLNQCQVECVTQARRSQRGERSPGMEYIVAPPRLGTLNNLSGVIKLLCDSLSQLWERGGEKPSQRLAKGRKGGAMACTDSQDPVTTPWRSRSSQMAVCPNGEKAGVCVPSNSLWQVPLCTS